MRRGSSLVETLLALFLLMCATLLVVSLFHASFRRSRGARQQVAAASWAQDLLDEATLWAQDPEHFLGNWAEWNRQRTDPATGLTAVLRADRTLSVLSPCAGFEAVAGGDPRQLEGSVARLQIDVRDSPQHKLVSLVTWLDEPARVLSAGPVQITRSGAADPVPREGQTHFEARLLDSTGRTIPGVTFDWFVRPGSGNAEFLGARHDGSTAVLVNRFQPRSAPLTHVPGTAVVVAHCRYRGKHYRGRAPVELGGPGGP